jgi:hypothetical protein
MELKPFVLTQLRRAIYSYNQNENIQLASLDFQISMKSLYEDVDFAVSDAGNNGLLQQSVEY